ncbi:MAG: Phosphate-selective porin O and P [Syntrophorhabdaceae bacterium PtaU1.Bin034]|nr:MAG: Phosphate-selective porin O and P [Syntrophorhabdaceae bacterium PtaU1.Bin034]
MRPKAIFVVLFLAAALLVTCPALWADQTDDLIQLLLEKGTITKDEAAALKKQVKPEAGQAVQPAAQDEWWKKVEAGYDKGMYVRTKDRSFSLLTNVGLQQQFNYQWLDDAQDKTTFSVRRARLIESGNAFFPWLKFYVQLTLEQSVNLRDGYVEAAYYQSFVPRAGQFKIPFDREFLVSAFNLQLVERSIASNEFSLQRDVGLQLAGFPLGDLFEYRVGIFNGSGANQDNVNNKYMYLGRFVFTPFGPVAYSQAALETPGKPQLAMGVAGAWLLGLLPGERRSLAGVLGSPSEVPVRSDVYQYTGDMVFKYLNFSFEGAYHYRTIDPRTATTFGRQDATGYMAQAGYFIIPKHFEVAGRYSFVNPDNPVTAHNNNQEELTGGASYYFKGHPLKVQASYTYLHTQETPHDGYDQVGRTQVTLMF